MKRISSQLGGYSTCLPRIYCKLNVTGITLLIQFTRESLACEKFSVQCNTLLAHGESLGSHHQLPSVCLNRMLVYVALG